MGEIPEGRMNAAMAMILAILSGAMLFASDIYMLAQGMRMRPSEL
jgi:hypothetical protein